VPEDITPKENPAGSAPSPRSLCLIISEGWKDFYSKSFKGKIDLALKFYEFLGSFIIVSMVFIVAFNELSHQFYIFSNNVMLSESVIANYANTRQHYIGDIFFVLILVEIISLIKAGTKDDKLTPTFPIVIGITSLIREIIKPKDAATPDAILMLTLGIVALSVAIWIIGRSLIDQVPVTTDNSNPFASSPDNAGDREP
jgi:phosphate starvation-inducible membrane PsiE